MRSTSSFFHLSFYILLALAIASITACSHISEDERLIYVKPAAVARQVLIEDFTGQRCVNCPNAHDEIAQLQQQYGEAVIAVSIHAGPLAFYSNARMLGLRTETGDAYYDHWQLEYLPVGLIDRSAPLDYASWSAKVREELQKTAPVNITLSATKIADSIEIQTTVQGANGDTDGHLQLWIIEDSITAMQLMPDGTANAAYVHNHVFRTAVNGPWGETLSVKEGELEERNHKLPIDSTWNALQLSVVAFVYDDNDVQQVVKERLKVQ